jgi:hypothetical protein
VQTTRPVTVNSEDEECREIDLRRRAGFHQIMAMRWLKADTAVGFDGRLIQRERSIRMLLQLCELHVFCYDPEAGMQRLAW